MGIFHPMHLGMGLFNTLKLEQKHRLKQRSLVAPTPRQTYALDHIGLPAPYIGKQVGNQ